MMAVIEAVLAGLGVLFLVVLALSLVSRDETPAPPVEDLAAPYREGLHAATRLQLAALDLEQQIYAEAARHAHDQRGGER